MGQGPPAGPPPGLDKAIAAKEKNAQRMLDKPGVAGIGVGLNPAGANRSSKGTGQQQPNVADLPDELEGVPVESITTGGIEPRSLPTDRFPRPVPMGVWAGWRALTTGAPGARVTDGTNVYVLSNNHVLAGVNTASIGDPIIQPGDADGGERSRRSHRDARGVPDDRLQRRHEHHGRRDRAHVDRQHGDSDAGRRVRRAKPSHAARADRPGRQKSGRTTGLQLGNVAATNVSVDVCYVVLGDFCLQEARFAGQFSISPGPFSAPGDSGSLVVTQGGNQPVGLLFAGGDGLSDRDTDRRRPAALRRDVDGTPPGPGPPSGPRVSARSRRTRVRYLVDATRLRRGLPGHGLQGVRGTSPGSESFHANAGTETTFGETGLTNGTTYYYRVSAENANGEGAALERGLGDADRPRGAARSATDR